MTPILGDLLALTQSLSVRELPEVVAGKALEYALAVLRQGVGVVFIRTPLGALRVASHQGVSPEGEAEVRQWCEPGSLIVQAIEDGQSQLFTADNNRLAKAVLLSVPGEDVRYLAVVPFPALGKSVGGMVLFLPQKPDKLLWDEGLPYIAATAGLVLAQLRLKETIATQERLASLGRMAAGVAHELKNPLTVLGASLELLRPHLQPGVEAQKKLDRAQDAFKRMVKLIGGLSGYSKPTRATIDPIPLSDLFSTVLDLLGAEARSRQIQILVRTSPPSLAIRGDRGQLLEVLINLVENAMDAIVRDGRIELQGDLAGGEVQISVRDSGPGIAPDLLDRVFDPFFTTKATGTGLGLAIVREIVEQLGGTIRVKSQPGTGTEFLVSFPSG